MAKIGIDLGGTKIEAVLLAENNQLITRQRIPTPRDFDDKNRYRLIIDSLLYLIELLETHAKATCTIGIGTPGTLSNESHLMKNCNTTCLNGQPLKRDLEIQLNREIYLANDANCFVLSEAINGAAKDYESVFGVIMGTGVGGGIVTNNKLQTGHMGIAGEWGHNPLSEQGPACYCGRKGCVETLISGPGFSLSYTMSGGDEGSTPEEIVQLAKRGDHIAIDCVETFLSNFGRAMATVINILDPHVIVLGGGLSNLDILYDRGRQAIEPHIFSDSFTTPILKNMHGDSSGVFGAAYLWDGI